MKLLCVLCELSSDCIHGFVFAVSYDHTRDDNAPISKTTSANENVRSHGLQTSTSSSASARPVNLHTAITPDITSQMTVLNKHPSSRASVQGTGNIFTA